MQSEIDAYGDDEAVQHDNPKPLHSIAECADSELFRRVPEIQSQSWVPIHNMWRWSDPDIGDMKQPVVVLFPSDIGKNENDVHVSLECD